MKKTRFTLLLTGLAASALLLGACGGGKDEEKPKAGSIDDISSAIESPTGTVSASTAADVAMAFEESGGVPTGSSRDQSQPIAAQDATVACDSSGDINVTADSGGESFDIGYNDCCMTAGCCINGDAQGFVDTSGTGTYSACYEYDLDYDCDGTSASMEFSFCQSATGEMIYAIEVEGDTFAVSGYISNGTGTLTVTGENCSFTCDYTDYAGSCTSDSGDTFTF
jgi:hypothetical protein